MKCNFNFYHYPKILFRVYAFQLPHALCDLPKYILIIEHWPRFNDISSGREISLTTAKKITYISGIGISTKNHIPLTFERNEKKQPTCYWKFMVEILRTSCKQLETVTEFQGMFEWEFCVNVLGFGIGEFRYFLNMIKKKLYN